MLKKKISYEDFEGEKQQEDFYFHLSKAELIEMELSHNEGGFVSYLQRIIKSNDGAQIIAEFKKLILMSYGKKSSDGKSFLKSQELRDDFVQTAAYSELFTELTTQTDKAVEFINGLVPKDLSQQAAGVERHEIPTTQDQSLVDEVPAWIREDRAPTNREAANMTREQLIEAYRKKSEN